LNNRETNKFKKNNTSFFGRGSDDEKLDTHEAEGT